MSMQQQWDAYSAPMTPESVSQPIRQEIKRAFYAGAIAYSAFMRGLSQTDKAGFIQAATAFELEILQFEQQVARGEA